MRLPRLDTEICTELCGIQLGEKCWRIRHREPCKKYNNVTYENKFLRQQEKHDLILIKMKKQELKDFENFTDDLCDSKGDDIGEEEFIENEQFFALHE